LGGGKKRRDIPEKEKKIELAKGGKKTKRGKAYQRWQVWEGERSINNKGEGRGGKRQFGTSTERKGEGLKVRRGGPGSRLLVDIAKKIKPQKKNQNVPQNQRGKRE